MSKFVRVVLAVIAAVLMIGLASVPAAPDQVPWQKADPELPTGG